MLNSNENQIFQYNGSPITFQNGNSVMVNATQMAKPFGKRPNDYLSLTSTNELLKAVTKKNGIADNQLVRTVKGGAVQGTWLHEDIALDFAQWLSIDFKLWCNDRIKELLTKGITTTTANDDQIIAQAMQVLQARLQASTQQLQMAESERDYYQAEVRQLTPKAQYTDEVLQSTSTYTFTQVAKDLGMRSVYVLTKLLEEKKIIYRQSGQWIPTARKGGGNLYERFYSIGYSLGYMDGKEGRSRANG